jgi:hypothetical protein
MKNKLINELAYVALIAVTLMCFACLDSEIVTDIAIPNPADDMVEQLAPGEGLAIGATAPEFSLPDGDGTLHSLSDYSDQKVVLVFFATWS